MKPTKMIFQRLEKKYLITARQRNELMAQASSYLKMDPFGPSTICNLYFDTDDHRLISTSLQKPPYKEKLRLRSYGIPNQDTLVYLEIKKKCRGVVNKRRIALTLQEADQYIHAGIPIPHTSQIVAEIDYFMQFYKPQPKIFLAYDRVPMIGKQQESLRMTFDSHIRRRYDHLDLSYGDSGRLLLEEGMTLMEIKVSDAYPLWLSHLLSDLSIYPISFSKYGKAFSVDFAQRNHANDLLHQSYQTERNNETETLIRRKGNIICSPIS